MSNHVDPVALSRLRTLRLTRAGAALIVVGSFAVSFLALKALATKAHIPAQLTWVWPGIVDLTTVIATAAVMSLSGRTDPDALKARRYFQWVLGGTVLVSVIGNGLHSWAADKPLAGWQAAAVAVVPPLLLLVATHGVTILGGLARIQTAEEIEPATDAGHQVNEQIDKLPQVTLERIEEPETAHPAVVVGELEQHPESQRCRAAPPTDRLWQAGPGAGRESSAARRCRRADRADRRTTRRCPPPHRAPIPVGAARGGNPRRTALDRGRRQTTRGGPVGLMPDDHLNETLTTNHTLTKENTMTNTMNDLDLLNADLMATRIPPNAFPKGAEQGDTLTGEIVDVTRRHRNDTKGKLLYWVDGKPQPIEDGRAVIDNYLIVQTDIRLDEEDDGRRSLRVDRDVQVALRAALTAAGASGIQIGARIEGFMLTVIDAAGNRHYDCNRYIPAPAA